MFICIFATTYHLDQLKERIRWDFFDYCLNDLLT